MVRGLNPKVIFTSTKEFNFHSPFIANPQFSNDVGLEMSPCTWGQQLKGYRLQWEGGEESSHLLMEPLPISGSQCKV